MFHKQRKSPPNLKGYQIRQANSVKGVMLRSLKRWMQAAKKEER